MDKLKWWFRIYGALYLLLGVMNLYFVLFNAPGMGDTLTPAMAKDPLAVLAFTDGWSPFAFEMFGIGTFLLWASRNPLRNVSVVWFAIWLELLHGLVDDWYLVARGYDVTQYIAFSVLHIVIIVTGIIFARQAESQNQVGARAAQPA
ncbi:MAG: BphX family protein [Chloroflexota bacterium]|nr:BphX family protein [Chloroflexota bacterium]